ncbi:ketol-acid reductoisomerase [Pseudomonas parafulva]|uniref:ketol-acid reductoisomerase n=1 Tax=Pseudomonas parafulva TaxID=157782 RepID=UPI00068D767E|nr:ketol-acid reductoisomerase [Pseudomonas parafulva]
MINRSAKGSPLKQMHWVALAVSILGLGASALYIRSALAEEELERAIVEPSMVQSAIDLEQRISSQSRLDAPEGTSPVVIIPGNNKVIITAPHATESFREGRYRMSDGAGTAALATMLNSLTCATVIYTQYRTRSDANYYDDNAFKDALAKLIHTSKPMLVLDIHGSHDSRPYEVDFGTLEGKSLFGDSTRLHQLIASLHKEGILNLSSNYFAAQKNRTITRFSHAKGVPAIQLEINSSWLRPAEGGLMAHRFAQVLQGLARYIRIITNNASGKCEQA